MSSLRLVSPGKRPDEGTPDPSQCEALEAIRNGAGQARRTSGHVVVTGGAGTGKTTLAVFAAADAVARGVAPERVLVLAPTRSAATALRDRVSFAMGVPTSVPMARTPAATAFAILSAQAALLGEARPSLVSGAEQDVVLRELLEGRISGRAERLDWGRDLPDEATVLPAFREELRNLLMRAAEADLDPHALRELGTQAGRPEWVAAAKLYAEYEGVMALRSTPGDQGARYDPATIVARAADALAGWEDEVGGAPPGWDLVIVDDYQDATVATTALLAQMAAGGARLVFIGNADESVQGYRGAVPGSLHAATDPKGFGAVRIELETDHRQSGVLAAVTGTIAGRIGVKGVGSARLTARAAVASTSSSDAGDLGRADVLEHLVPVPTPVTVMTAPHGYGQSRAIAAELRSARHGLEGPAIAWGRMAVIARSAMALRSLRSDLLAADIPCESLGEGVALHKEPAVSPLLTILRAALGEPWTEDTAVEVLTSRLIGLDPVGLRRLRRELVREDRSSGGSRSSSELLVDALTQPAGFSSIAGAEASAARRACAAVAAANAKVTSGNATAGNSTAGNSTAGTATAGNSTAGTATAGEVVWAAWEALGVADAWRESALSGSARDDADLDAIIGLLRAAQTFTERLPEARAEAFLDYLEGQDFAADSLGARAATDNAVSFATAASAQGREWDVVVIAGLEEGAWPRLTLRDSLLGAQRLADVLADGPLGAAERATGSVDLRSARAAVLDDETRALLVAVSRARVRLIVTAVDDGETRPSRFMSLIEQAAGVTRCSASSRRGIADLRAAVAALRSGADLPTAATTYGVAGGDMEDAFVESRATMLALLAREGVAGADPDTWHGVALPSTDEPFWRDDETVRVSPSKVEWVEKCAYRWALESVGGTRESTSAQEVGSLLHAIAEEHPHGGAEAILADFEARWKAAFGVDTWPERAAYMRGREMAVRLAAYLDTRSEREVLVEQPFRVELGRAVLSGKADRIELRPEGAYVVDLKTGRSVPTAAEAAENGQLAMYQLAVAEGAVPGVSIAAGAELAYLSTGKAGAVRSQEPIDPAVARERLDAVVTTMTGAWFAANINDSCGSCALRRSCPAHAEGAQVTDS